MLAGQNVKRELLLLHDEGDDLARMFLPTALPSRTTRNNKWTKIKSRVREQKRDKQEMLTKGISANKKIMFQLFG
jgi:hypothetical protein